MHFKNGGALHQLKWRRVNMDVRFVQIDRFLHLLHFPLLLIFGRHIDDTFLGLNKNIAFQIRVATVNECLKKLKKYSEGYKKDIWNKDGIKGRRENKEKEINNGLNLGNFLWNLPIVHLWNVLYFLYTTISGAIWEEI